MTTKAELIESTTRYQQPIDLIAAELDFPNIPEGQNSNHERLFIERYLVNTVLTELLVFYEDRQQPLNISNGSINYLLGKEIDTEDTTNWWRSRMLNNLKQIQESLTDSLFPITKGIAFFGLPGSGKTSIISELRSTLENPFVIDENKYGANSPTYTNRQKRNATRSTSLEDIEHRKIISQNYIDKRLVDFIQHIDKNWIRIQESQYMLIQGEIIQTMASLLAYGNFPEIPETWIAILKIFPIMPKLCVFINTEKEIRYERILIQGDIQRRVNALEHEEQIDFWLHKIMEELEKEFITITNNDTKDDLLQNITALLETRNE